VAHRPDRLNPQATGAIGHRIHDHTRFAGRRLEARHIVRDVARAELQIAPDTPHIGFD
jgi:hypothetical protein